METTIIYTDVEGNVHSMEVSESIIQDVLLIIHPVYDIDLTPLYQYPDLQTGAEGGR